MNKASEETYDSVFIVALENVAKRIYETAVSKGWLVGENLRLKWENETLRQQVDELRAKAQSFWDTLEDVACGARIDCVTCGQPKPCQCDKR